MRLEREIIEKKVYEPIRGGGWFVNLQPPQHVEYCEDEVKKPYVEVVTYVYV